MAVSLPVHNGEVGIGYLAVAFQATGGTAPYTWSLSSGSLPPGLTLSSDGVLTGTNTTAGNFPFTVKASDSSGQTGTGSTGIGVFPPLGVSQPCSQLCTVGYACTQCGRFGTVTGGAGPYTYKLVGGGVPTGMSLNGLALVGAFPAPPVINQPVDVIGPVITRFIYSLSVQVTDDFGATKTVSANWLEFFPMFMDCTNGQACATCFSGSCTTGIDYSGGSPADLVTVRVIKVCDGQGNCLTNPSDIANALPPAFSASAKGGVVTLSYNCGNSCPNGYNRDLIVQLVDHGSCVASQYVVSVNTADFNISFSGIIG